MTKNWNSWAPLPLRLMLGFGFIYHGFPKVFTAAGHENFVGMLQGIGVPAPELMAWAVGILEVLGGLALLAGAFVTITATLLTIDMIVAMVMVHLPQGFSFLNIIGMTDEGPVFGMPGYEVNLLYIAGLLSLIISGAGVLSIDSLRKSRRVEADVSASERAKREYVEVGRRGDRQEKNLLRNHIAYNPRHSL